MNEQEQEPSAENTEEHADPGTEAAKGRPIFVWFLGVVLVLYALSLLIGVVVTGRLPGGPVGLAVILTVGLLGAGVLVGMRWALVLLRVVWVLFCVLLVLSFLAASAIGAPNWGHGVGLALALMLIPIWSDSVKAFCSKTQEDLRE